MGNTKINKIWIQYFKNILVDKEGHNLDDSTYTEEAGKIDEQITKK